MTIDSTRISRRAVTRGAAWAVPLAVASLAVPGGAEARTPCTSPASYRLDWGTTPYEKHPTEHRGTATVAGHGDATPVVVTFTSAVHGTVHRSRDNLTWEASLPNTGGKGQDERGLVLSHGDVVSGRQHRQMVTIAFSRPVKELAFTIVGIDGADYPHDEDHWDRVELTGEPAGSAAPHVVGRGTHGSPWHIDDEDAFVSNATDHGSVSVAYAHSVTHVTLTLWSATSGGGQSIVLSDVTFQAACS